MIARRAHSLAGRSRASQSTVDSGARRPSRAQQKQGEGGGAEARSVDRQTDGARGLRALVSGRER
jgi:hypothetical protein